ncbi:hypothetical protein PX699_18745 [Sphingobium sp. H39-3-25]|uniref:hypothetical protein n=1 Tax=Sphingobium arseniciresistens TaxID=3030834 RepID=UPI0023BA0E75|nr:hypothetical protein [Sphingobium arseniciresistens]
MFLAFFLGRGEVYRQRVPDEPAHLRARRENGILSASGKQTERQQHADAQQLDRSDLATFPAICRCQISNWKKNAIAMHVRKIEQLPLWDQYRHRIAPPCLRTRQTKPQIRRDHYLWREETSGDIECQ